MSNTSSDRLNRILVETPILKDDSLYPMISLPDNDTYWSECISNEINNDLCISSSSSIPSSSSVSPYSTSSSSASPSLSSNSISNQKTNHSELIQLNDLNSHPTYFESFLGKVFYFIISFNQVLLILN